MSFEESWEAVGCSRSEVVDGVDTTGFRLIELPLMTFDSCELSDTLVTTDDFERLSDIVILLLPLLCEDECWDFFSLIAALTASG